MWLQRDASASFNMTSNPRRKARLMSPSSSFIATDGDSYELQMGRWSRRLAPLFIRFARIAGAVRVLDVGCGTGNLSFCLGKDPEILAVTGLDASPAYVEHANRRNGDPAWTSSSGMLAHCHSPTLPSTTSPRCLRCNLFRKSMLPCVKCGG